MNMANENSKKSWVAFVCDSEFLAIFAKKKKHFQTVGKLELKKDINRIFKIINNYFYIKIKVEY